MINDALDILVIAFAAWRLAYALVNEDVFQWLRDALRVEEIDNGAFVTRSSKTFFGRMLTCVYCTSFWTTGLMIALFETIPELVVWFAVAGVAVYLSRYHE